jgi:phage terminase small subunit
VGVDVSNLSPKQLLFVKEYLVDLNATKAAIRAGYSEKTAQQIGTENLLKPVISAAIKDEMAKREERTEITQDKVLNELAKIGFFDIRKLLDSEGNPIPLHELDDKTSAAIAGLDILEEYIGTGKDRVFVGYVKKYKIADKRAALVDIGKHLGMFIERKEVGSPGDFDKLNDDELQQSIERAADIIERARVKSKVSASTQRTAKAAGRK